MLPFFFLFFQGAVVNVVRAEMGQDDRAVIGGELHGVRGACVCVYVCVRETKSVITGCVEEKRRVVSPRGPLIRADHDNHGCY